MKAAPKTAVPVDAEPSTLASASAKDDRASDKLSRKNVMRDSFSMPLDDYALIGQLKKRCVRLGVAMKKSELLRAGLRSLSGMSDERLLDTVGAVPSIKTGRPPARAVANESAG